MHYKNTEAELWQRRRQKEHVTRTKAGTKQVGAKLKKRSGF
jgi:hypothetical protein